MSGRSRRRASRAVLSRRALLRSGLGLLAVPVLAGCTRSSAGPTAPSASSGAASPGSAPAASAASPVATVAALPPSPNRPVAQVTVGVLGTSSDVVFFYPDEQGWFEHMKIEPQFERFDSGGRMVSSLAANQVQIGGGSPSVGLYNAIARGVDVKIVADRASGAPGYIFFVRKDLADSGAIRDWADLRGKRIAIAVKGTTAEVVVGRALEKGGLTLADAEILEIPYPDQVTALSTGAIDVGVAPEPSPTIAVGRGVAVKWHTAADVDPHQEGSVLMYTGAFIEEQPDVARDFMVAFLMGVRAYNDAFVKQVPDTLAAIKKTVLERTSVKDPHLLDRMEWTHVDPNGALDRIGLENDYQWFRQYGGLTETIDLDQLVDMRFADHAISVLGTYS